MRRAHARRLWAAVWSSSSRTRSSSCGKSPLRSRSRSASSILHRAAIRRGVFHNLAALRSAIQQFLDACNDNRHPFAWVNTPDQILAKANRQVTFRLAVLAARLAPDTISAATAAPACHLRRHLERVDSSLITWIGGSRRGY